jgi:hypothetical protein
MGAKIDCLPLWKRNRGVLQGRLLILACATIFIFRAGVPKNPLAMGDKSPEIKGKAGADVLSQRGVQNSTVAAASLAVPAGGVVPDFTGNKVPAVIGPLDASVVFIKGSYRNEIGLYRYVFSVDGFEHTDKDIIELGYRVIPMGFCFAKIMYKKKITQIGCKPPPSSDGLGGSSPSGGAVNYLSGRMVVDGRGL